MLKTSSSGRTCSASAGRGVAAPPVAEWMRSLLSFSAASGRTISSGTLAAAHHKGYTTWLVSGM